MRTTYSDGREITVDFLTWECRAVPLVDILRELHPMQERSPADYQWMHVLPSARENPGLPLGSEYDSFGLMLECPAKVSHRLFDTC